MTHTHHRTCYRLVYVRIHTPAGSLLFMMYLPSIHCWQLNNKSTEIN